MTASVTIEVARAENVIKVPNAALRFQPSTEAVPASAQQAAGARGRRVWTLNNGQLQPMQVRPGISDGTTTAILGGDLVENTSIVTGVSASTATPAASTSSSPLIPQRPGGNRQTGTGARGGMQ
jgi:HlyD family secretion protein